MRTCISQHLEQLLTVGEGVRLSPRADQSDDGRGRERLVNGLPRRHRRRSSSCSSIPSERSLPVKPLPRPRAPFGLSSIQKGRRRGFKDGRLALRTGRRCLGRGQSLGRCGDGRCGDEVCGGGRCDATLEQIPGRRR